MKRQGKASDVSSPCSFPDCGRDRVAHGLCAGHYAQRKRGRELAPLEPRRSRTGTCSVFLCDFPIEARGLCCTHYQRDRRARRREDG